MFDRMEPAIADVLAGAPSLDFGDVHTLRAQYLDMLSGAGGEPTPSAVTHHDHLAPGMPGHPDVLVRIFRPSTVDGALPCVYWIQGGGYILPNADLDDALCEHLVLEQACVVVSVAWRRAPEHPFPAAIEDCYAGLRFIVQQADRLGVDPQRVVVGGHSSGGGAAAGVALLVRDRGEFSLRHQVLVYPMLDDTNTSRSSHEITDPRVWNRQANELGWRSYLGSTYGTADVSPYAAPSRMEDLSGVAPASMLTGELDLFRDEDVEYATRLMHAGVSTELHVYRGAPHGFFRHAPSADASRRFMADLASILRRALAAE